MPKKISYLVADDRYTQGLFINDVTTAFFIIDNCHAIILSQKPLTSFPNTSFSLYIRAYKFVFKKVSHFWLVLVKIIHHYKFFFPLFQNLSSASLLAPKHERTRSSPSSLTDFVEETSAEAWAAGRISPRYETPPGTPPPPYSGGQRFNPEVSSSFFNHLIFEIPETLKLWQTE